MSLVLALVAGQAGQAPALPPSPSAPGTPPAAAQPPPAPPPSQEEALPVLGFQEALRQAGVTSLDLAAARARLERASALVRQAWAGYLPTLALSGTYTRNSVEARIQLPTGYFIRDVGAPPPGTPGPNDPALPPSPENPPGGPSNFILYPSGTIEAVVQARDQLAGVAELRQAVFAPTLWAAIHSANLGERASTLQLDAARRQVLFGTAQLYLGAAGLKETVGIQERLRDIQREQLRLAEERVNTGSAPRIDVLRAQIDLARAEQDLVRTRNALRSARSSLATLIGRAPDFDVVGAQALPADAPLPADAEGLLETALAQRPDLQAARVGVQQAQTVRQSVLLSYLPALGVSAQYRISNVAGFAPSNRVWAIVAALTWTLWDGGAREAQLRAARAGILEAEAGEQASRLRVLDEVRRGLYELASARTNRQTAAQQLALAQENLRLVQLAYVSGAASSLDQSNAFSQLAAAELTALNERVSAYLASLAVLRAAGLFDSPDDAVPKGP